MGGFGSRGGLRLIVPLKQGPADNSDSGSRACESTSQRPEERAPKQPVTTIVRDSDSGAADESAADSK